MKKILKSKRGVAIESAVLFMLVIFSMCVLLSCVTLTGHYQTKLEAVQLKNRVDLDQIGEDFVGGKLSSESDTEEVSKTQYNGTAYYYTITSDASGQTLRVFAGEASGTVILCVTKTGSAVTGWHYGKPTQSS